MSEALQRLDVLMPGENHDPLQADSTSAAMIERVREQQSALFLLMKSGVLGQTEQAAFSALTEISAATLAVARVSIWLFSPDCETLVLADSYNAANNTHGNGITLEASSYPAYFEALKWNRVIAVSDAQVDPRTSEFTRDYLLPNNIVSLIDAGIWQMGNRVGVICVESINARRLWTPDEKQFAASIADIVVIHFENRSRCTAQQQLAQSRNSFSQVFGMSQDMMVITRLADGIVLDVNEAFFKQTGYATDEIIGKSARQLGLWVDPAKRDEWWQLFTRDGEVRALEVEMRHKSGDIRSHQISSELIEFEGERCAITISRDFTDARRQARLVFEIAQGVAASTGETFFRSLVECLLKALDADLAFVGEMSPSDTSKVVAIAVHNRDGPGQAFAYDLAGSPCRNIIDKGICVYASDVDKLFPHDLALTKKGIQGYVGAPLLNSDGQALGLIAVLFKRPIEDSDMAVQLMRIFSVRASVELERRDQFAQLQYRASYDLLTGLANRTTLEERIDRDIRARQTHLAGASAAGTRAALLLIDLDRFKEINATLGHGVGDKVVARIAARLQNEQLAGAIRGAEIARTGGDEFAVWFAGNTDFGQISFAVSRLMDAITAPLDVEGYPLEVGASIGIAIHPDNADSASKLLRCADIAMYEAKKRGSGIVYYDQTHDPYSPQRLTLMSQISQAVRGKQFEVFYQPRTHLANSQPAGFEALVRWRHPQLGLLLPGKFIPLAELSDVIRPLTFHVLDQAIGQLRQWQGIGNGLAVVGVNLSARNLMDDECANVIRKLLDKHAVNPALLELEITESVIIADPEKAQKTLNDIHAMGVRIAIDDFGTGFSSLSHLKRLPLHALKIDVSFVTHMLQNAQDAAIVESIICLAHSLGLGVVAEGIEDRQTEARLRALGCDQGQGFYIGRPLPAEEATAWLLACLDSARQPS